MSILLNVINRNIFTFVCHLEVIKTFSKQYSNVICKTIKSGRRVGYSCVQEIRLGNKILLQSCLIFVSYLARFVNEDSFSMYRSVPLFTLRGTKYKNSPALLSPPPPSLSQSTVYTLYTATHCLYIIQTVCGWEGVWGC
jgi:hypothetical protein